MNKKTIFDYEFKALNLTDFELILLFTLDGKLARYARAGIVKSIKMKTGKNIGKVNVWVDVPPSMYNFVNLQSKAFIKIINNKELKPDGITIVNHHLSKGSYKDDLKTIYLKLLLTGQYKDER